MSELMEDAVAALRSRLRHTPVSGRIRATAGDEVVVDSVRAALVWEPGRIVPSYAVPEADLRAEPRPGEVLPAAGPGLLHPGIPFVHHSTPGTALDLHVGSRTLAGAGFRPDDADLAGLVLLDFAAFDGWLEEDDPLVAHPRDPYHRVETRPSTREVRIEHAGRPLALSRRALLVFETSLPPRYYLHRADVLEPLTASSQVSACAYKGVASYWSVEGAENIAWSYEAPVAGMERLTGLVAFWNDFVDITVDGVPQGRPDDEIARSLADEFGLDA